MYNNQYQQQGYYTNSGEYYQQYGGYYYPPAGEYGGYQYYQTGQETPKQQPELMEEKPLPVPESMDEGKVKGSRQTEPLPPGDDDMELESPTTEEPVSTMLHSDPAPPPAPPPPPPPSQLPPCPPSQSEEKNQHYQSNQSDESLKKSENQSDMSYVQSQYQYDQPYPQASNQSDQSSTHNQFQSYPQASNQSDQLNTHGQYQYDQSVQPNQYHHENQTPHVQGQNQSDQSVQYGQNYQNQYNQSYQQGPVQYNQPYQYDQSYNQGYPPYQYYQYDQHMYYQHYPPHHEQGHGYNWEQGGSGGWNAHWQQGRHPDGGHPPVNKEVLPNSPHGQEPRWGQNQWPQWEGHSDTRGRGQFPLHPQNQGGFRGRGGRGRGRGTRGSTGRGRIVNSPGRQSRWDSPNSPAKGKQQDYSNVPPPEHKEQETPKSSSSPLTVSSSPTTPVSTATCISSDEITSEKKSVDPSRWPPTLRNYIMKSFESCKDDEERNHVEQYLKVEIFAMFEDKRVWQIDWEKEPLALEKIKRPRQKRRSRWDTPSPTADLKRPSPPLAPVMGPGVNGGQRGVVQETEEETVTVIGRGRGRGWKKKKNKRGKGRFYIDRSGDDPLAGLSEEDKARVNLRSQRFAKGSEGNRTFKQKMSIQDMIKTVFVAGEDDWKDCAIEGTSQELVKRYLRLTSAPDPSTVRPVVVLQKSLTFVLSRWEKDSDYHFSCEQFKSIRQDLTIQNIRNEFTVEVYETHARIALQNGDWSEFNQCQSQLRSLYTEGIPGYRAEFMAYRILYHMMTNETSDFVQIMNELTTDISSNPAVNHALKLCNAWSSGNYNRFFKLYQTIPHCGRHLVDLFLQRERRKALKTMAKAYRLTLPVDYITKILGFTSQDDCVAFLIGSDAVLDEGRTTMDCRPTQLKLSK